VRPVRGATVAALAASLLFAACAPDPPSAVVGVRAEGCGTGPAEGTGAFVDDDLVLTAAHTVAGATSVEVVRDGVRQPAEIVGFDPDLDLAVLRTDDHIRQSLTGDPPHPPGRGTPAVAYVVRDGRVIRLPLTIIRPVTIATTDIYREGATERPGFELAGWIVQGDSGAPVLVDGRLVGVVWARSNRALGRAYAIDAAAAPREVSGDLTRCAG
jgi:S1-C subfamily serine protease